jgi:hypothetical protein
MTNSSAAYEPPHVFDLGDFVAMTAGANPNNNNSKPCVDPDGNSGNIGNMSGGACGGIGS